MPARKKHSLITKQKRLIATRLMQISLLVEDYLYNQKSMSQRSAAAYIDEISGYKDKCYSDERSLQVIEKLTRCMKGIIYEQQELHGECGTENNLILPFQDPLQKNNNEMLSPVYSIADEDLTQLSFIEINDNIILNEKIHDKGTVSYQNNEKGEVETRELTINKDLLDNANEGSESDLNVLQHCNDNTQIVLQKDPLNIDMEAIDLCDDEIDDLIRESNSFRFHHEPGFNIQNAISHISIRDIQEAFTTPFSQECSQSILDNYYPAHNTSNIQNYQRIDLAVPLTQNDVTATVTRQNPATDMMDKDKLKIVLPTTKPNTNVSLHAANKPVAVLKINTQPKDIERSKIAKTKKRLYTTIRKNIKELPETATTSISNNNNNKTKAKHKNVKVNETKELTQDDAMQNTYNSAQNLNIHSDNHLNLTVTTKNPLTYSKVQLDAENTDKGFTKTHNKEALPIYNRAVVEDLSWIENIRFVREIPSEEYEPFTENEVFWENYTLPDVWNEDDFNY